MLAFLYCVHMSISYLLMLVPPLPTHAGAPPSINQYQ